MYLKLTLSALLNLLFLNFNNNHISITISAIMAFIFGIMGILLPFLIIRVLLKHKSEVSLPDFKYSYLIVDLKTKHSL